MAEPRPYKKHAIVQISDETGKIWLALWRNQVDQVKVGDIIVLINAFTRPDEGKFAIQTWQEVIPKVSSSEFEKSKYKKESKKVLSKKTK